MMLIEQTPVPDEALPVAEFREHLRLGSGFADDALQDPVLLPILKSAIAVAERETSKALFRRTFQWVLAAWRDHGRQSLPKAPAHSILSLTITDLAGGETVIDPSVYRLIQDAHKPDIMALSWALPTIPVGGTAEIVFEAGFAASWGDVPADLARAVMMLGAHYYDHRGMVTDRAPGVPQGVEALLARHRPVRLFGRSGK